MSKVVIADIKDRALSEGIDELFAAFGGVTRVLDKSRRIWIKPNAIHFTPQTHTDPKVLEALLAYLRDHGYGRLAVFENATAGNFTRLVFHAAGYTRICRRYGARPIYLDEGPTTAVRLREETETIRVPKRLVTALIDGREQNAYLSLPKLKTHSMATVTMGVKNQQAFPVHADRMHRHNAKTLHRRLAALYDWIRPDFCLIDGTTAVFHGHFPPTSLLDECVAPMDILIGGVDTVATDVVGARALGYEVGEVEHLAQCAAWDLGAADLGAIEVIGVPLERFERKFPFTLLGKTHPDVRIVEGRNKACKEGCKGNSLCILEMLTNDFNGRGGWTLVYGDGVEEARLDDAPGPILVVGPCAVGQLKDRLCQRFPKRTLYFVDACNDLMRNATYQARLSGVPPLKMTPINPVKAAWLLALARLHGSTARIPPLFG